MELVGPLPLRRAGFVDSPLRSQTPFTCKRLSSSTCQYCATSYQALKCERGVNAFTWIPLLPALSIVLSTLVPSLPGINFSSNISLCLNNRRLLQRQTVYDCILSFINSLTRSPFHIKQTLCLRNKHRMLNIIIYGENCISNVYCFLLETDIRKCLHCFLYAWLFCWIWGLYKS